MKQKQLEIFLQKVPLPQDPKPEWEQYITPAPIAADIIYAAHHFDDIYDKTVLDLGCGTGIFAIGAALTGAQNVIGIDIDTRLISQAQHFAQQENISVTYKTQNITTVTTQADTVFMNPPFGAQKAHLHADRRFLEKACEISTTIYSLHLNKTLPFIETMIKALRAEITWEKQYAHTIPHQFSFHTKPQKKFTVSALRIQTDK